MKKQVEDCWVASFSFFLWCWGWGELPGIAGLASLVSFLEIWALECWAEARGLADL